MPRMSSPHRDALWVRAAVVATERVPERDDADSEVGDGEELTHGNGSHLTGGRSSGGVATRAASG